MATAVVVYLIVLAVFFAGCLVLGWWLDRPSPAEQVRAEAQRRAWLIRQQEAAATQAIQQASRAAFARMLQTAREEARRRPPDDWSEPW